MPRFYFDIHVGSLVYPDEHGLEFGSLEAAQAEAASLALELAIENQRSNVGNTTVAVRDERRQTVVTVNLALHIEQRVNSLARA